MSWGFWAMATNDIADNLYNGDVVRVQGYNDDFNVTVYDNAVMRYLPFV